ncbi:MAG: hypothetical protein NTZ51_08980, partial [Proteobacteria bacterium]|nr:hypothetical protein [Pseudomonadota bacterium]
LFPDLECNQLFLNVQNAFDNISDLLVGHMVSFEYSIDGNFIYILFILKTVTDCTLFFMFQDADWMCY